MRLTTVAFLISAALARAALAQTPPPAPAALDWSADDSARIGDLTKNGRRYPGHHAIVWAPPDSLDPSHVVALVDSLDLSLSALKDLMGAPYTWQRLGGRPVQFYLSPGRFVSHATGRGAVLVPLWRVQQGAAPLLHEASHELLATTAPFYPWELADSLARHSAETLFPLWLSEGLADYLAQATAAATGFHEGDIFHVGGLQHVDSVCAARLAVSPWRAAIVGKVGGQGRLDALFTTDRAEVAPTFYPCSQSLTKYLVQQIGVREVVGLFPAIPVGAWAAALETRLGEAVADLRRAWLAKLGLPALADHAASP